MKEESPKRGRMSEEGCVFSWSTWHSEGWMPRNEAINGSGAEKSSDHEAFMAESM